MLKLVSCLPVEEKIAFSLVHRRGRVDVPVRGVQRIDVLEETRFFDTRGQLWTIPGVVIEVDLTFEIKRRIFELTRQIVHEPLNILVGAECILAPIVREPLGPYDAFRLTSDNLSEAWSLAERMLRGTVRAELRVVTRRDA